MEERRTDATTTGRKEEREPRETRINIDKRSTDETNWNNTRATAHSTLSRDNRGDHGISREPTANSNVHTSQPLNSICKQQTSLQADNFSSDINLVENCKQELYHHITPSLSTRSAEHSTTQQHHSIRSYEERSSLTSEQSPTTMSDQRFSPSQHHYTDITTSSEHHHSNMPTLSEHHHINSSANIATRSEHHHSNSSANIATSCEHDHSNSSANIAISAEHHHSNSSANITTSSEHHHSNSFANIAISSEHHHSNNIINTTPRFTSRQSVLESSIRSPEDVNTQPSSKRASNHYHRVPRRRVTKKSSDTIEPLIKPLTESARVRYRKPLQRKSDSLEAMLVVYEGRRYRIGDDQLSSSDESNTDDSSTSIYSHNIIGSILDNSQNPYHADSDSTLTSDDDISLTTADCDTLPSPSNTQEISDTTNRMASDELAINIHNMRGDSTRCKPISTRHYNRASKSCTSLFFTPSEIVSCQNTTCNSVVCSSAEVKAGQVSSMVRSNVNDSVPNISPIITSIIDESTGSEHIEPVTMPTNTENIESVTMLSSTTNVEPVQRSSSTEAIEPVKKSSITQNIAAVLRSSTQNIEPEMRSSSTENIEPVIRSSSTKNIEPIIRSSSTKNIEPVIRSSSTKNIEPVIRSSSTENIEPVVRSSSTSNLDPVIRSSSTDNINPITRPLSNENLEPGPVSKIGESDIPVKRKRSRIPIRVTRVHPSYAPSSGPSSSEIKGSRNFLTTQTNLDTEDAPSKILPINSASKPVHTDRNSADQTIRTRPASGTLASIRVDCIRSAHRKSTSKTSDIVRPINLEIELNSVEDSRTGTANKSYVHDKHVRKNVRAKKTISSTPILPVAKLRQETLITTTQSIQLPKSSSQPSTTTNTLEFPGIHPRIKPIKSKPSPRKNVTEVNNLNRDKCNLTVNTKTENTGRVKAEVARKNGSLQNKSLGHTIAESQKCNMTSLACLHASASNNPESQDHSSEIASPNARHQLHKSEKRSGINNTSSHISRKIYSQASTSTAEDQIKRSSNANSRTKAMPERLPGTSVEPDTAQTRSHLTNSSISEKRSHSIIIDTLISDVDANASATQVESSAVSSVLNTTQGTYTQLTYNKHPTDNQQISNRNSTNTQPTSTTSASDRVHQETNKDSNQPTTSTNLTSISSPHGDPSDTQESYQEVTSELTSHNLFHDDYNSRETQQQEQQEPQEQQEQQEQQAEILASSMQGLDERPLSSTLLTHGVSAIHNKPASASETGEQVELNSNISLTQHSNIHTSHTPHSHTSRASRLEVTYHTPNPSTSRDSSTSNSFTSDSISNSSTSNSFASSSTSNSSASNSYTSNSTSDSLTFNIPIANSPTSNSASNSSTSNSFNSNSTSNTITFNSFIANFPASASPTSNLPISFSPTSNLPTSNSPTSASPTSNLPNSLSPTSNLTTSNSSISNSPTSNLPTSNSPASNSPASNFPTSNFPISNSPTSILQTSNSPTSNFPTSNFPTSNSPTSNLPIPNSPTASPSTLSREFIYDEIQPADLQQHYRNLAHSEAAFNQFQQRNQQYRYSMQQYHYLQQQQLQYYHYQQQERQQQQIQQQLQQQSLQRQQRHQQQQRRQQQQQRQQWQQQREQQLREQWQQQRNQQQQQREQQERQRRQQQRQQQQERQQQQQEQRHQQQLRYQQQNNANYSIDNTMANQQAQQSQCIASTIVSPNYYNVPIPLADNNGSMHPSATPESTINSNQQTDTNERNHTPITGNIPGSEAVSPAESLVTVADAAAAANLLITAAVDEAAERTTTTYETAAGDEATAATVEAIFDIMADSESDDSELEEVSMEWIQHMSPAINNTSTSETTFVYDFTSYPFSHPQQLQMFQSTSRFQVPAAAAANGRSISPSYHIINPSSQDHRPLSSGPRTTTPHTEVIVQRESPVHQPYVNNSPIFERSITPPTTNSNLNFDYGEYPTALAYLRSLLPSIQTPRVPINPSVSPSQGVQYTANPLSTPLNSSPLSTRSMHYPSTIHSPSFPHARTPSPIATSRAHTTVLPSIRRTRPDIVAPSRQQKTATERLIDSLTLPYKYRTLNQHKSCHARAEESSGEIQASKSRHESGESAEQRSSDEAQARKSRYESRSKAQQSSGEASNSPHESRVTDEHSSGVEDERKEECVICLCDLIEDDDVRRLPCMHIFHAACVDEWFKQDWRCPVCRTYISSRLSEHP